MNDWKKDLDKKFIEIKKEEKDGLPNQTNSSLRDRSIGRGRRNVDLSNIRKKINNFRDNYKGGELMIGLEGALRDVDDILKGSYNDREAKKVVELKSDLEKIGAIVKVLLKFLSTMRTNQLLTETEKTEIRKKRLERTEKKT